MTPRTGTGPREHFEDDVAVPRRVDVERRPVVELRELEGPADRQLPRDAEPPLPRDNLATLLIEDRRDVPVDLSAVSKPPT